GSSLTPTPAASAIASRVRSSAVGPIPPETSSRSQRVASSRAALAIAARPSPTWRTSTTSAPTVRSCRAIHRALASAMAPRTSSSPVERIATLRIGADTASSSPSHAEADVQDVAILDHVVLAHQVGVAERLQLLQIGRRLDLLPRDHLGADEAAREVAVD